MVAPDPVVGDALVVPAQLHPFASSPHRGQPRLPIRTAPPRLRSPPSRRGPTIPPPRPSWRRVGRVRAVPHGPRRQPLRRRTAVMNIRVRTTLSSPAPDSASASRMISKHRRAWSPAPSGQPPPGSTGPVPETITRSPTRMARLNPMVGSNGEPEETPCRSVMAASSHSPAARARGVRVRNRRYDDPRSEVGWVSNRRRITVAVGAPHC